jgi:hypothetical protein
MREKGKSMKAFIVEVILPDSWTTVDTICGINIGLQKHFITQSLGSAHAEAFQRKLDDPRGIRTSTTVIAELPLR